jgi:hypothetical protein
MNGIMNRKLRAKVGIDQSLHNFTMRGLDSDGYVAIPMLPSCARLGPFDFPLDLARGFGKTGRLASAAVPTLTVMALWFLALTVVV